MPAKKLPEPPRSPEVTEDGYFIHRYRVRLKAQLSELELELFCFATGRTTDLGGLGKYRHFRNAAKIIWPNLIWHEWLEKQIESLCENTWLGFCGCAASGKTFGGILFAMLWWLCSPRTSTVILTSTSGKMIRKRAWPVVRKLFYSAEHGFVGNMVDSKTTLQAEKGDDKNGIFAIAVKDGPVEKAVADIQGIHSPRIMVIMDEAEDNPPAIYDVVANLIAGTTEFRVLYCFNPVSKFSRCGQWSEPMDGWGSIGLDDHEWQTKQKMDGKPGHMLRFDAELGPNIVAGRTLYPFLTTQSQLDGARRSLGEASPLYWKNWRGMYAPAGLVKTIFSETEIQKFDGPGRHVFIGRRFFRVAGFDPAFGGGDRPSLQFADVGDIDDNGTLGVQLTERVLLSINARSTNPIGFQLAEQLQRECDARKTPPENVAIDSTGEGGTLCDIVARTWSNQIIRVEFGGRPSDLPCSETDIRPASEVYRRKNVELWYQARLFLIASQLKGIDPDLAMEFCNRTFDDTGQKIELQLKTLMKAAFGRSPDLADAATLAVEVARQKGAGIGGIGARAGSGAGSWLATARKFDKLFQTDTGYERKKHGGYYGSFQVDRTG